MATFYALFSLEPEPPVVAHVCTDVACIARGSGSCGRPRAAGRPRGRAPGQRPGGLAREPVPGHVRARPRPWSPRRGRSRTRCRWRPRAARRRGHARRRTGARQAAAHRPAARRPVAAAAAPRRRGRPREHRQLPRARRLRGAARGARHGPGRRAPRGLGLQAPGPRRRRVPDRPQVGGGGPQREAPALPDLQRRRVRAGDVQGPRDPRGRPVLDHRGDDDRRHHHGLRARLPVPARRVSAGLGAPGRGDHGRARPRLPRPGHPRLRHSLRHRAAQGRRRLHLRRGDGALQLDRGLPRRAAQQAAVPGRRGAVRQADGDQQRRDARQRARHRARGRRGLREDRHGELDRHAPVLPVGLRRAAGPLRGAVRGHAARGPRAWRAASPAAGRCARSCSAAPRALRHARRAGHRDVLRGDAGGRREHGLGRRDGGRRHRRPSRDPDAARGVLPRRVLRAVRALPRGHRPPGGGARAPRQRPPARSVEQEYALLDEITASMRDASICGLGQTAADAIESALRKLDVFETGGQR